MKRKVVLHIVNSNHFSGLESVAIDIIKQTNDMYENYYITKDGPVVDALKEKGIEYRLIKKVSVSEIKRIFHELKPSLIHAHDYKASCICALSNVKIPVISHLHNNSPWIKTFHPFSFLYLWSSKKFDKILVVSDSIEKEYVFSRFIKHKIQNIGNPVSRAKIVNNITGETNYKKYDICCVARITAQKNPFKFLEIVANVKKEKPNLKCVWVGEGELLDSCNIRVNELGISDNVKFVGFQKNPYDFMNKSKIFLLTSDWEGYGLVAFEALTLGLPCVVSDVGGLHNIVDSNCGELLNDSDLIITELLNLLNNDSYYKRKSENAVIKSKQLDNSDRYIENIKSLYNSLIGK